MEPATLYMMMKLADGSERSWKFQFPAREVCETQLDSLLKRKAANVSVLHSACVPRTDDAPEWFVSTKQEKLIEGVPLELKYRPFTGQPD